MPLLLLFVFLSIPFASAHEAENPAVGSCFCEKTRVNNGWWLQQTMKRQSTLGAMILKEETFPPNTFESTLLDRCDQDVAILQAIGVCKI